MKSRLLLYFVPLPERDRWIPGDRFARRIVRRLVRGAPSIGGVERVFRNLCLGFDRLGVPYEVNVPFDSIRDGDRVVTLGVGKHALAGYTARNPIVAGIGLMTHPSEWPTLLEDYPVARYLQHSEWAANLVRPYFGERCVLWPAGIDAERWRPDESSATTDVLIYDKVMWDRDACNRALVDPIIDHLRRTGRTFVMVRYGKYTESEYRALLATTRSVIYLCEHESQGLANQEALAMDVPIFAWDQGFCLDPNRFRWGVPTIPATSVPFFDERCGMRFKDAAGFIAGWDAFFQRVTDRSFRPRAFILENLTVERSAQRMLDILDDVYGRQ